MYRVSSFKPTFIEELQSHTVTNKRDLEKVLYKMYTTVELNTWKTKISAHCMVIPNEKFYTSVRARSSFCKSNLQSKKKY